MADAPTDPPRKKIVLDLDWLPEPPPGPHTVTFLPGGRQATVEHGQSVFEAGKSIGEYIPTDCGGKGTCGLCRVRVHGEVRPPTYVEKAFIPREDLAHNVRLSCRLRVEHDVAVTVLRSSTHRRTQLTRSGLHVFQKKSTRGIATPRRELELVRARLRQAEAIDAERRRQGL